MTINIIVAHGKNKEIGYRNDLLWKLPLDMKRFVELTKGHTVVMGRKTFESIGRPLPNRENIILSKQPSYNFPKEVKVSKYTDSILKLSREREIFIIGGAEVYKAFLPYADRLYITLVNGKFKADTYFPDYEDNLFRYNLVENTHNLSDNDNPLDTRFLTYERKF